MTVAETRGGPAASRRRSLQHPRHAPGRAFDRAAALAARWFDVPIATVTIVDEDRIWFKATHGLSGVRQVDRELGLCASAILQDAPYHVADALRDPRVADNSLVHGRPWGAVLRRRPADHADGHRLGTVNVLDVVPRRSPAAS